MLKLIETCARASKDFRHVFIKLIYHIQQNLSVAYLIDSWICLLANRASYIGNIRYVNLDFKLCCVLFLLIFVDFANHKKFPCLQYFLAQYTGERKKCKKEYMKTLMHRL